MNKLFLLAAGYVAGSVVSSLFSQDKWDKLRKKMQSAKAQWKDTKKIVLDYFIDTQKSALESLKSQALTETNVSKFNEKKSDLLAVVDDYKKQGEAMLADLDTNGSDYIKTAQTKLEALYQQKVAQIKDIKWEDVEKIGQSLLKSFENLKKSLTKKNK